MISPTKSTPLAPEDFVGEAADYARIIDGIVRDSRSNGCEAIKLLLNGVPGIGKSALVRYLAHRLGCDQFNITKLNGTQIRLETVEELSRSLCYAALSGDYTLLWIDEADTINRLAQVRFLTMIDDIRDGVAIACTSNCKVEEFEPRFQSRFQVCELSAPTAAHIETLLRRWPLQAEDIASIAKGARGNVRQALLDARTALNAAN